MAKILKKITRKAGLKYVKNYERNMDSHEWEITEPPETRRKVTPSVRNFFFFGESIYLDLDTYTKKDSKMYTVAIYSPRTYFKCKKCGLLSVTDSEDNKNNLTPEIMKENLHCSDVVIKQLLL